MLILNGGKKLLELFTNIKKKKEHKNWKDIKNTTEMSQRYEEPD